MIKVMKFGGTSVASHSARAACIEKVKQAVQNNFQVVVVVSAMGRKGDPYSTDSLLSLACGSIPAREKDLLTSCGETISAAVFASELWEQGISAAVLTGGQAGIFTNSEHTDARILSIDTKRLEKTLENYKAAVVCGFQGIDKHGDVTTLGRGASDLTAVALANALGCKTVEIYTDVDGIMTADPRLVPEAVTLEEIGYEDVFEFASKGARVIHPLAVDCARKTGLGIWIKNSTTNNTGTLIHDISLVNEWCSSPVGITAVDGKTAFFITIADMQQCAEILNHLAEHSISIDVINVTSGRLCFITSESDAGKITGEILCKAPATAVKGVCKVSLICNRMTGVPGVMHSVISSLASCGIDPLLTSDSQTTISIVVPSRQMEKAAKAIHAAEFPPQMRSQKTQIVNS